MPWLQTSVFVDGLRKTYGELVAVDDASFTAAQGEISRLLGLNGAGKTTTVECAIGLGTPEVGAVRVLTAPRRARPLPLDRLHMRHADRLRSALVPHPSNARRPHAPPTS
jgi:ABC-type branched-subunit amino acid transport system ATPase component